MKHFALLLVVGLLFSCQTMKNERQLQARVSALRLEYGLLKDSVVQLRKEKEKIEARLFWLRYKRTSEYKQRMEGRWFKSNLDAKLSSSVR